MKGTALTVATRFLTCEDETVYEAQHVRKRAATSTGGPGFDDIIKKKETDPESAMRIVHYPHPALRHKSKPISTIDRELHLNVGRMMELMYEAKGLGLAAPQVALPYQLLVMNISGDPKQPEKEEVFVNPIIVDKKGVIDDEEGCLSFPGLYQNVRRAKAIKVQAYDLKGNLVEKVVNDLEARAWQHEIDHLNGVLLIDMMGPIAKLSSRSSVKNFERAFKKAQEKGEIPPEFEIEKLLAAMEANA